MITKGIIKGIPPFEGNKYSVYIPLLRTASDSEGDATFQATLCYTSGIINTLKVGDVVFVDFEDNYYDKPVILGKLYVGQELTTPTQIIAKTLKVLEKFDLETGFPNTNELSKDNLDSIEGLRQEISSLKEQLLKINK